MLTAILRSRTIGAVAVTYILAIAMVAFAFWQRSEGGHENELLMLHWAFSWTDRFPVAIPLISLLSVSALAVISRIQIQTSRQFSANSNLLMIAILSFVLGAGDNMFARPDVLLGTLISVGMFRLLFSTHKRESVLSEIFHVGFLLGLAALILGPLILYLLGVGFVIIVLRSGTWKEWAVLLLGICMVAVFVLMVTVWAESPTLAFQQAVSAGWTEATTQAALTLRHGFLLPSLIVAAIGLLSSLTQGNVAERNLAVSHAGWIATTLLMVVALDVEVRNGVVLAAYPMGVFLAKQIESVKRGWIADLLLLAIIAAPFVSTLWRL